MKMRYQQISKLSTSKLKEILRQMPHALRERVNSTLIALKLQASEAQAMAQELDALYHAQLRRLHVLDASDLGRKALRRCLEHESGSGVGFKVIVDKGTVFRFRQGVEGI